MNRFAAAVALGFALTGAGRADDPAELLAGTYTVTALAKGGKDVPADVRKATTVRIAAGELTFVIKDKAFPAKIAKLDPAAKPAAIDLAPADGPEKGKTFLGIYSYQDGELTLAFTEKGDRPADFGGAGDATVVKLKKVAKADKD
jgi:uncharacterized protein (TIGR03067 family)